MYEELEVRSKNLREKVQKTATDYFYIIGLVGVINIVASNYIPTWLSVSVMVLLIGLGIFRTKAMTRGKGYKNRVDEWNKVYNEYITSLDYFSIEFTGSMFDLAEGIVVFTDKYNERHCIEWGIEELKTLGYNLKGNIPKEIHLRYFRKSVYNVNTGSKMFIGWHIVGADGENSK